jgi:hypothetical protein
MQKSTSDHSLRLFVSRATAAPERALAAFSLAVSFFCAGFLVVAIFISSVFNLY